MTSPIPPTGPVPYEPPAPQPSPRPWQRKPVIAAAAAVGAVLIIVVVLLAIGVFGGGTMTVHGTEQVSANPFNGMNATDAYPDITAGAQVTVVDPSGKVIGTGSLAEADPSAWDLYDAVYSFTVTVPAGESRYGIEIGQNRGTVWFTPQQMASGPGLSLSG